MQTQDLSQAQLAFVVEGTDADRFNVLRFHGSEALCRLYRFDVYLSAAESDVDFDEIVNQPATLTVNGPQGPRSFHGRVSRFELVGQTYDQCYFRAELVPDVWLLTQRYNCRIFQNQTVPEIITRVLSDAGLSADAFEARVAGEHPPREYCVQYRETDYNFIARLMESEGIWWYFEHSEDRHVLVCADAAAAYAPLDGSAELPFVPPGGMVVAQEHVSEFRLGQSVRSGAVALNDFNFENPRLKLWSNADAEHDTQLEHCDYPGDYASQSDGQRVAKLRIEELEAERAAGSGTSDCTRLAPARTFDLSGHSCTSVNGSYLVTAVTHEGRQSTHRTASATNGRLFENGWHGPAGRWLYHAGRATDSLPGSINGNGHPAALDAGAPAYSCRFECVPAAVTYRPARVTPRPDMRGTQTARVVGPEGEEIYTDAYGRVKVQFNWDRDGGFRENASCWIRVCHGMAGGQYGMMFLPRVGQEVVVDFFEGDPDRPIIIGRVYNADHMPPYTLPDEKTKSVIKTNSSKGGDGTNEIRFEDLKDQEQFLIYAQKDHHERANNDRIESVGRDRHLTVENNLHELVKQGKHAEVGLDLKSKVGGNQYVDVTFDAVERIGGQNYREVKGKYYLHVAQDLVLESAKGICLKVGGNYITIDPSGIYVMGTVVHLNGEGSALNGTAVDVQSPEAPLEADTVSPGHDETYTAETDDSDPPDADKETETSWIEIELVDEAGQPWPNEPYEIIEPDGTNKTGSLDQNGQAHVAVSDPGQCQISFPNLDRRAWERT